MPIMSLTRHSSGFWPSGLSSATVSLAWNCGSYSTSFRIPSRFSVGIVTCRLSDLCRAFPKIEEPAPLEI